MRQKIHRLHALICGALTTCLPFVSSVTFAQQAPYCLALRGNGDSQPAHWGALANLVEKQGLPIAQAGGSSATISLFLLDNLAANPILTKVSDDVKNRRAALLLKSLYGVALYIGAKPEVGAGVLSYHALLTSRMDLLKVFAKAAEGSVTGGSDVNLSQFRLLAEDLTTAGVGSTPRYAAVLKSLKDAGSLKLLSPKNARRFAFYSQDLYKAVSTLTAFDAEGDAGLFFRDGIIDFEKFAQSVGKIATFLSGAASNAATTAAFNSFVQQCEVAQVGHTWQELETLAPNCQQQLNAALDLFFAQNINWDQVNAANSLMGSHIHTLATTAVLTGAAYVEADKIYKLYHRNLDRNVATKFKVADISDVHFGYWGEAQTLALIAKNLRQPFTDAMGRRFDFSSDFTSSKFMSLGPATWIDVLSYSPAEPGLSPFKKMKVGDVDAYSAGGWSDLHPIALLKAAGCEQVIYVTRKGGESLFGQGIAKRVFNLDRPWSVLATTPDAVDAKNVVINNLGDPTDMTSLWSRMFNVANPKSSYMTAVRSADAVLCTDWDRFSAETQLSDLVTESYQAPFLSSATNPNLAASLAAAGARLITPDVASANPQDWAGCRSPSLEATANSTKQP